MKFISTLAFGLIGLGAVLKILLETLFNEWDAFNDVARRVAFIFSGRTGHVSLIRAEDILLESEKRNLRGPGVRATRQTEQRRLQIKEINAVEARLNRSQFKPPD
ncbi:MAG: hypothetical protein PHF00_04860 [Elusimicrobia bacterium]|nr:hypothetical protein [Elusimicrobiota bacterium]